jgi:hypothetical protein
MRRDSCKNSVRVMRRELQLRSHRYIRDRECTVVGELVIDEMREFPAVRSIFWNERGIVKSSTSNSPADGMR